MGTAGRAADRPTHTSQMTGFLTNWTALPMEPTTLSDGAAYTAAEQTRRGTSEADP